MKRGLVAALVAAGAPAAFAQTQQSEFERYALTIATPCMQAQMTLEGAPGAITTCEKLTADVTTLKSAVPDIAGHDLNVYHIVTATAHVRIARASAIVHGLNTQLVCSAFENAWKHIAQASPAASPGYAGTLKSLADATAVETAACRKLFAAPEGAPPLPAP